MIEQVFFAANVLKIFEGGWVPLVDRRAASCSSC